MISDKISGNVPKLRFPEFREAGEWRETQLGSIGVFTGGGTPSKDKAIYWKGNNPWISSSDISDDNIQNICISRFISDEAIEETATKLVPANSIVLVSRVGVGKLAITRNPICTSQDFTNFTPARDNLVFLAYCLKSLKDKFLAFNQGMAIKGFTKDDASNLIIPLPMQSEQQKIADCLSSLDGLIAAQTQKLDTLKTHKKGLMQQLFPAEGETLPKLRFPEFREAGEWDIREISAFAKVTTGGKDTQNKVDSGIYPFFVRSQTVERINSYSYDGEAVLTSGDGVGVGKNYHYIKGKFDFHQRVYCIYDFSECVSGLFFYLYFSEHFNDRVMKMSAKNSVDSVRMPMVTEMPVLLPSLFEQQKIADCLSSLDDLITAETQQLEALKKHKKGLMQQLFPASAAMDENL